MNSKSSWFASANQIAWWNNCAFALALATCLAWYLLRDAVLVRNDDGITLGYVEAFAVSPLDGYTYAAVMYAGLEKGGGLYRRRDYQLFWTMISSHLSHSFNGYHSGVDLAFTPDGRKLFVRRGTSGEKGRAADLEQLF